MKILVTGGTGYIGSQMARMLSEKGEEVVAFDDLSGGYERTRSKIRLIRGNILEKRDLEKVFQENDFDAVMHFAGVISMAESMVNPGKYFEINSFGALNLLEQSVKFRVKKFIFSSSAGVYGNPVRLPIKESDPKQPTNPYGQSKLMVEQILQWYDRIYGIKSISLRYFNAAGASLDGKFGEDHRPETHLIPLAIKAALQKSEFTIYGNDYQTKDGTCVRDYVQVVDLCEAHLLALEALAAGHQTDVFNVGPGIGYSNNEVVAMVKKISGVDFTVKYGGRRRGDANELIADASKMKRELNWQPKYSDLEMIVKTAWQWHKNHPEGY